MTKAKRAATNRHDGDDNGGVERDLAVDGFVAGEGDSDEGVWKTGGGSGGI